MGSQVHSVPLSPQRPEITSPSATIVADNYGCSSCSSDCVVASGRIQGDFVCDGQPAWVFAKVCGATLGEEFLGDLTWEGVLYKRGVRWQHVSCSCGHCLGLRKGLTSAEVPAKANESIPG